MLRPLVPLPAAVADRYQTFLEGKDEYDILYLGSSATWRSFIPITIDAELSRRGQPLRSFNFGIAGLNNFELDHLLQRLLATKPRQLRWVILEYVYSNPRGMLGKELRFTERYLYWHTPSQPRDLIWSLRHSGAPYSVQLSRAMRHTLYALGQTSNLGQADRILTRLLEPRSREPSETGASRGFQALDAERRASVFKRRLAWYESSILTLDARNERRVSTRKFNHRKIRGLISAVREAGAEPVFVLLPRIDPTPFIYRLHQEGVLPTLLAFNSPGRYPERYRADHHGDRDHLNREGAEIFSQLFAEKFADLLDEHEPSS